MLGVDPLGDQLDRLQQLAHAVQRQEVRLERDVDFVHGGQRVDREDAQRRRAIEDEVVERPTVPLGVTLHLLAELDLAAGHAGQFQLDGGQVDVGGTDPEVLACLLTDVCERSVLDEDVVHRLVGQPGRLQHAAEVQRGMGLRVEVGQAARGGPRRASAALRLTAVVVLPTPAFLIDDRDLAHARASLRRFDGASMFEQPALLRAGVYGGCPERFQTSRAAGYAAVRADPLCPPQDQPRQAWHGASFPSGSWRPCIAAGDSTANRRCNRRISGKAQWAIHRSGQENDHTSYRTLSSRWSHDTRNRSSPRIKWPRNVP